MQCCSGFSTQLFLWKGVEIKTQRYLCSFCESILRDPVQRYCGHRFCKECCQQCVANKSSCPECLKDGEYSDEPVSFDPGYPDFAMKREMASIPSKCYFEGCSWTGPFKEFELVHCSECSFRPRECSACHQTVSRSQSNEHLSTQSQVVHVECLFEDIRKLKEKIGTNVEGDRGSFMPILERIFQIEQTLQNIQRELSSIGSQTEKLTREKNGETTTEKRGNRNGEGNASGASDEGKLKIIENVLIVYNREFEALTTQVQKLERQQLIAKNMMEYKMNALERELQIKDVTIAEQDRRISELEQTTFDGTLVWRISDFSRKREDAISGRATSFYSPAFYTSKAGYKMCVHIYLNGDGMGKGTHVSLSFMIMRGQNDALLTWPFRQKVTLMFVDQDNHSHVTNTIKADRRGNSFKRPTTEMNCAAGCPLFMPISQLDSQVNAYIKDNTAIIKVIVSPD